jgi:septal ring factor EnvC (AmiA/AmiB activator)
MENRFSESRTTQNTRNTRSKLFFAVSAVSALIVVSVAAWAQPTERARTEALARRATDRLQALQREADRMASDERTLLGDLRKLEIERQIRAEELKQAAADTVKVQAELDSTAARMDGLQKADRTQQPALRKRLVEIYKLGQARYLRMLLATPDLERLGQSTRTVAALTKLDRERVEAHARTVKELKATRQALEGRRGQLAALRTSAEKAQAAGQRAAFARSELVRDIDRRRDLNAQLAGELQVAQQKLQAMLRDMTNGVPVAETAALPLGPFRGDLMWPVDGTLKRRFSPSSVSNGIEIAAFGGADARAIHEGVVAFAGIFAGFGNLVILEHGSRAFSLYGDLLTIQVRKGARVERGQAVGSVGPTQSGSDGLYFELRVDGQPVDPVQWLKKR